MDSIVSKSDEELKALKEAGVDDLYIGVECGLNDVLEKHNKGYSADDTRRECLRLNAVGIRAGKNEAYFAAFALALAESVRIPVILVGGHRSIENMEKVLNAGKVDFPSLSRPLIREPALPNRWAAGDPRPAACISCNMCYRTPGHVCIFHLCGTEEK